MTLDRFAPVVLIHGLGRTTGSMLPLGWRLERRGWRTIRIGYPSTQSTLAEAVATVRSHLPDGPCHLVGHSLGGLIAAALIRDRQGALINRGVQLGSPNLGSSLATRLKDFWLVQRACGPAYMDVTALKDTPSPCDRIAAIAGTGGWAIPGTGLERPHDGAVSARSAHAGAGHCALVPVLHTLLPASARVASLVDEYLTHGRFLKEDK